MLSINSGHSADYLLDAVAAGRESYFTGAVAEGEPPGRWYGTGAESLGLTGLVDADVMRAVYGGFRDPRDPEGGTVLGNAPRRYPNAETQLEKLRALEPDATPERLEELAAQATRMVRNNVSFHDATFSVPKSVTVLHASFESQEVKALAEGRYVEALGWQAHRLAVEEAIWAGNRAAIDYLATHSGYTRIGDHSTRAGRWTDAHDWTVASFFQHDSRTHDPQLHIHNAILNRVQTKDGRWLTLAGKDLNLSRRAAGAVGERTMFEHLTTTLGVQVAMRADGVSREIMGVDKRVMDHFSTRSQALTPKAAEIAREWEAKHGRTPNSQQLHRFKQQATLATRPAKEHTGQTSIERLERWDRELRAELGSDLAAEAHRVLGLAATPPEPRPFSVDAVMETAVAEVQSGNSRFTESTLVAAVDAALPDYLGGLSGDEVHELVRGVALEALEAEGTLEMTCRGPADESLMDEYRLDNGRSVFEQPASRLYATAEHVRSERALQAAAVERGAAAVSAEMANTFVDELAELGIELGYDQRQAVTGVLTDGANLSALVGPAGCIAGETELWDPVAMRGRRIDELCAAKIRPWVQTLSGPVRAEAPYLKGFAALYRVELADGRSCLATADHLFLTRFGWCRVSDISVGLDILGGSVPDTAHPSESLAGAHRCSETSVGSQVGCLQCCRLCDPPLPHGSVADRGFVPLRSDVLGHVPCSPLQGDQASTATRNHAYPVSDHLSTQGSTHHSYDVTSGENPLALPASLASGFRDESSIRELVASLYLPSNLWNQESRRPRPSTSPCRDVSHKRLPVHDGSNWSDLASTHYRSQLVPITSIEYERTGEYFDLHVPDAEHYLANGIWHHNSGKSFVVGALAKAWQDSALWNGDAHRVVGLASSQVATEVLAGEGLDALNVSAWLAVHQRLADGKIRDDSDANWALRDGDLVVLDESAMAGTAEITRIRERVEAAGGKLLLTGDHRQLASVGAGGGMSLVANAGMSYELTEVRRFHSDWERGASLALREGDPESLHEYRKHGRIVDGGTIEQTQAKATRAFVADKLAGRDALLIADTNEMAANLSASVRADLVRLDRVQEDGVPVGKFGAFAGVGDVVETRKLAWDLAGYEGNRRGPLNRERSTVTEVRADGGLVVDHLGERMTLPESYMQHVELGYASTVHSAQGLTVESSHVVTTSKTSPAGLYVGLSRGRDWNAAYVTTIAVPDDSPPGAAHDSVHRDPAAALAGVLERPVQDRSAIEEAEDAEEFAGSVMTAGERLSVVAAQACAGRTAAMLDRLTSVGALSEDQRRRLAADAGMVSLSTVLRQAEVAGHDPDAVLETAVREKSLDGARSLVSVLHSRISDAVSLEPVGDSHADWVPKVADPQWNQHVRDLAKVADERAAELGALAADEAPQWAVETLGPVPEEATERKSWMDRAGTVAAHRELTKYESETEALPGPPARTQVEAYASWRAGWRALGRPEIDRAEREMSDGQLRMRVRAMERENAWQPPYVARELSGTAQAAERARETAEIRKAEAAVATDPVKRELWEREAQEAATLAASLADQAQELKREDTVRGLWYAHTAPTRAAASRAGAELAARGVDLENPPNLVTARELLEAQREGMEADDRYREITDAAEFAHVDRAHRRDLDALGDAWRAGTEAVVPDIRDVTADEDRPVHTVEDWTRVPDISEVAEGVSLAQRALNEMEQHRVTLDARADLDERDRDAYSWEDAEEVLDAEQYDTAGG